VSSFQYYYNNDSDDDDNNNDNDYDYDYDYYYLAKGGMLSVPRTVSWSQYCRVLSQPTLVSNRTSP